MYYAKSMYGGGKVLCADEIKSYKAYLEQGLRCLKCGEPVFFKDGREKSPHFAHFPGVEFSQCPLRVTGYNQEWSWSTLTPEGKGQRRKIFEDHFIEMIARSRSDFKESITLIQENTTSKKLNELTQSTCKFFIKKELYYKDDLRKLPMDYNLEDVLIKAIAIEVIDYISIRSSRHLLEKLVCYSIFDSLHSLDFSSPVYLDIQIEKMQPDLVCQKLLEIIVKTDWLSQFPNFDRDKSRNKPFRTSTKPKNDINEITKNIRNYFSTDRTPSPFNAGDSLVKLLLRDNDIVLLDAKFSGHREIAVIASIRDCSPDRNNAQEIIISWDYQGELHKVTEEIIENFLKSKLKSKSKSGVKIKFNYIGNHIRQIQEEQKKRNEERERQIQEEQKKRNEERERDQEKQKRIREEKRQMKIQALKNNQVRCPRCGQFVCKNNLNKHLEKVHKKLN